LATEYLNLNEVSNYRQPNTYFPTYGPCYVEIFEKPNNYRIKKTNKNIKSTDDSKTNNLNENIDSSDKYELDIYDSIVADGSFYVGRLLMSVESKRIQSSSDFKNLLRRNKDSFFNKNSNNKYIYTEFISFVMLDQITMIDSRFKNGDISIKLCMGINGYDNSIDKWNQTDSIKPVQFSKEEPICLPFEKSKPCLCLNFSNQDMRHVLFKKNFIENSLKSIVKNYEKLKTRIWNKDVNELKLQQANDSYKEIVQLAQNVKTYLKDEYLNNNFITDFEQKRVEEILFRLTIIIDLINLILKLSKKFKYSTANDNFKFYIDLIIKNSVLKIRNFLREPFCIFPNVSLWLLFNNQPVGVCNISANDIIWSNDEQNKGEFCGKLFSTDFKVKI
jgi:hypothetical protein